MDSGKVIRNWKLVRLLGEGGMGTVWLAESQTIGTLAAIKVLSRALTYEPEFRERLAQEARTQARLKHHSIASVYDFFEESGECCLVAEYMEKGSLGDHIEQQNGPLPKKQALAWAKQILQGLAHAHKNQVIHRDVKPSNILIDLHDNAKLTDFGIAIAVGGRRMTATGVAAGTAHYMSPEQIRTPRDIDHRTDIYSFGVVMYEMLTGRLPFESDSDFAVKTAHVNEQPPPLRSINPEVPPQLEAIVLKALSKDRSARQASCEVLLCELEEYEEIKASKQSVSPSTPLPPQKIVQTQERTITDIKFYIFLFFIKFAVVFLGALLYQRLTMH